MNLIFLDSEGTIRTRGKILSNIDEIFNQYEQNDLVPILATGLPKHLILNHYKNVYDFKYLISSNGALITNSFNEVLYYEPIKTNILEFLVEERKNYRFHIKATVYGEEYTTNINYVDEHTHYLTFDEIKTLKDYSQVYIKVDLNLSDEEKLEIINNFDNSNLSKKDKRKYLKLLENKNVDDIYKFIAYINLIPLREKVKKIEGIVIGNESENFYNFDIENEDTWLSINASGVSKYSAIKFLSNYLKVDLTNTIFVGNDLNDQEALLNCPFSISVLGKKRKINVSNGLNIKERNVEFVLYYLLAYLKSGFSVNEFKKDIFNTDLNIPLIARLSDCKESISNIRFGARGVVFNEDNEVVLFYKERIGEIKLPGGGLEANEKPVDAFRREIMEETGYSISDIKLVGYTLERKRRNNFKQFSFVFTAKTASNDIAKPTEEEQLDLGRKITYSKAVAAMKFEHALSELKNLESLDLYHEKFIVKRDKKIFNYVTKRAKL